jgi:hypothetical protein
MKDRVEDTVIKTLFRLEPVSEEQISAERVRRAQAQRHEPQRFQFSAPAKSSAPQAPATIVRKDAKVGRSDPCPCGSGKKYKKCHGAATAAGGATQTARSRPSKRGRIAPAPDPTPQTDVPTSSWCR